MAKLSYYQFLLKSSNAHNVHSPFVYSLVTKALTSRNIHFPSYNNEMQQAMGKPVMNVLCRILFNLKKEKLFVIGDTSGAITETIRACGEHLNLKLWFFSPLAPIPGNVDLVYVEPLDRDTIVESIEKLHHNLGEKTIVVIGNIHSSAEGEACWERLKSDPNITVTIDTYHLGMVFLRPGQAKEDFYIRATTSKLTDFLLGARKLWGLLH